MKKKIKIGIIGFGNMGSSFYKALAASGRYQVRVYDRLKKKTKGQPGCSSIESLLEACEVVILAIKPQDIAEFMAKSAQSISKNKILLISIAAGVSTKSLESYAKGLRVVRAMPNLCAQVFQSISFLSKGRFAKASDLQRAKKILSCLGKVIDCQENFLDKATAISGSGPGYVFYFMAAVYKAALGIGFSKPESREIVVQTFLGASLLAKSRAKDFRVLMDEVASQGGTTEAAFRVFQSGGLEKIIIKAVKAAKQRAAQLSKEL